MSTITVADRTAPPPERQATLVDQERRLGFWMTLPAQLLLMFIVLFPMAMQIYLSMSYWGPTEGGDWTHAYASFNWFDNYTRLLADDEFWHSVGRTLIIMVIAVPLEFLFGLPSVRASPAHLELFARLKNFGGRAAWYDGL